MAFSVRIEIYSGPCTTPMLWVEPNWWNADELMKDIRFKCEPEMAGYDDYVADLTWEEFNELHQLYLIQRFSRRICESCGGLKAGDPKAAMLDAAVALHKGDNCRFHVTVFEWESGY